MRDITIPGFLFAYLLFMVFALLGLIIWTWAWPALRQAVDTRRAHKRDMSEVAVAERRTKRTEAGATYVDHAAALPAYGLPVDVPGYTISNGENGTTPGTYVKAPTPPVPVANSGIGEPHQNCKSSVDPKYSGLYTDTTSARIGETRTFGLGVPHQLVQIQLPSGSLTDNSFGDRRPTDIVRTRGNRVEVWRPVKPSRGTALGAARTRLDRDIRIGYVMGNPYTNLNGVVYRNGRRLPKPAFAPRLNYNLLGWAGASRFDGRAKAQKAAVVDTLDMAKRTITDLTTEVTAERRRRIAAEIRADAKQITLDQERSNYVRLRARLAEKDRTIGYLRLRIQGLQREASASNEAVTRATEKAKSAEWAVSGLRDALDRAYAARNERHAEHQAEVTAHAEAEKTLLHRISLAHDDLRDLRHRIRKLKGKK